MAPSAPRSVEALDQAARERLAAVVAAAAAARAAQERVGRLVDDLRGAGVSWHAVGWAVGTTGESARQRYGGARPPSARRARPRLKGAAA